MSQFFQWLSDLLHGARVWTIVLPWEKAVRVRCGRWTKSWDPGLHWRIPFFDQIRIINTRLRLAPVPCVTVSTKDGKTVTAAGVVGFRIADPYQALLTIQQPENAAAAMAQAALAEYIVTRHSGELDVSELEMVALDTIRKNGLDGLEFIYVKTVDFAVVRTFRLLQEQWRPSTDFTNFEPPKL